MTDQPKILLIIPIYNPRGSWEQDLIDRYNEFCESFGRLIDMVVVNDGSSNDISSELDRLTFRLGSQVSVITYHKNRGKGGALKSGAKDGYDLYVFTDYDFPYTVDSMNRVCKTLIDVRGVVTGHRKDAYYNEINDFRTYLSKGLRKLNSWMLGLPTNDTQCGLKGFDSEARGILLACSTERFLIDLEFLLAANKKGFKITPVDVELRPDTEFTTFNPLVLLKELTNFLIILIKYR